MRVIAVPEVEHLYELPPGCTQRVVALDEIPGAVEEGADVVFLRAPEQMDSLTSWLASVRAKDSGVAVLGISQGSDRSLEERVALWLGLDGVWLPADGPGPLRAMMRRGIQSAATRSIVVLGDPQVREMLLEAGVRVPIRHVDDEHAALVALRSPGTFAVVLDPEGRDMPAFVAASARYSAAIRVIAAVHADDHARVPRALEEGASDFLLLPPGPRQVRDVLDRAWAQTGIAGVFSSGRSSLRHIALVEDDETFGHLIGRYIRRGFPTASLQRMNRLAELSAASPAPDVVLLDLNLPDSHGLETVVLARTALPRVPIIVLTASDPEIGLSAIACGAQDFFPKSQLDGTWLCTRIRFALERQRWVSESTALANDLRSREFAWRSALGSLSTPLVMVDRTGHTASMTQTAADLLECAVDATIALTIDESDREDEVVLRTPAGAVWRATRRSAQELSLLELITPMKSP